MNEGNKLTLRITDLNRSTIRTQTSAQERKKVLIGPGARGAVAASGIQISLGGGDEQELRTIFAAKISSCICYMSV
jgi:hypothetical protein